MAPYMFLFPAGTAGSFVKHLFFYYLHKLGQHEPNVRIIVNPITGDCHSAAIRHYHFVTDAFARPDAKVVVIRFDDDDKPLIAKMLYHKHFKRWIKKNQTEALMNWPELDGNFDDGPKQEAAFLSNLDSKIPRDWEDDIEQLDNIVLSISFKEIFSADLNKILADYFQTDRLPEVDDYIAQYRQINKKYFNT